jgi:hypothetical protein
VAPKTRKDYDSGLPKTEARRLQWMPLGLMLLAVVGMGLGVWVVRRR